MKNVSYTFLYKTNNNNISIEFINIFKPFLSLNYRAICLLLGLVIFELIYFERI